jgi:hypothetical protein
MSPDFSSKPNAEPSRIGIWKAGCEIDRNWFPYHGPTGSWATRGQLDV